MKVLKLLVPSVFLFSLIAFSSNAQDKSEKNGEVFFVVEEMPVYPGGQEQMRKDIANAVKYPEAAKKNGIQGKVYISFVVDKQGKITEATIARGVDPSLDKEALRVLNSLEKTWTPGKQKGKAVKVKYTIPINFALDSGKSTDSKVTTTETSGDVFLIVEEMPEFPGGDEALREYIAKAVKYPEEAHKKGIQGKVYVSFVIDVNGDVINPKIERGVDPALDKESIRVVSELPKWKPGKQRGQVVKVRYTIPINFALS